MRLPRGFEQVAGLEMLHDCRLIFDGIEIARLVLVGHDEPDRMSPLGSSAITTR